jgi:hypothetical protein
LSKFSFSLRKSVAQLAIIGAAGFLASTAQADVLTLDGMANGFEEGTVTTLDPAMSGLADLGQLSFSQNTNGNLSTLLTYCIEVSQSTSDAPTEYGIVDGITYFGAAKAEAIGKLFSGFDLWNTDQVTTTAETAALQLALWEITHETAMDAGMIDLDLSSGNFSAVMNNQDISVLAQGWLDALPGVTNVYKVDALHNPDFQDLLALSTAATEVPEPASIALVLGALGAMGATSRRRKAAAAV